ncbi:MAG: potassium channel protein [Bacteroidota bacterium]
MTSTPRKLLQISSVVVLILCSGVLGYHIIEGWTFFDALYMTVITLATVGYGEVHSLSQAGRIFTVFLIFGGMGILLYSVTEMTAFFVEGEMTGYLRRRKMKQRITRLSDHFILCGWGLKGEHVYDELTRTRRHCVVVEIDPAKIERLRDRNAYVVEGDSTKDEVLMAAGIARASGLVTTLPTDKDNLFVVITARGMNSSMRIVAKIDDLSSKEKFIRSGANAVVSGNYIGGLRLASELIRPDTVNFLDTMLRDNSTLRVEDIHVGEHSKYVDKPIEECLPLNDSKILLFSIKHAGAFSFNPSKKTKIERGDTLVVIGFPDQLLALRSSLGNAG